MYTHAKRKNLKRQSTRDIAGICTVYTQAKRKNLKRQCTGDIAGICTHKLNEITSNDNVLGTLQVHVHKNFAWFYVEKK